MKRVKLIALLAAVVTALLIFVYLGAGGGSASEADVSVVVAAVNIPANSKITQEMVATVEMPESVKIGGAITENSQVVGRMATEKIYAGEQIISQKLVAAGAENNDTLAYSIQPGMRAISLAVTDTTGVAGMIRPYDHVDIIADFEDPVETMPGVFTTMVVENVTVLAVDSTMDKAGNLELKDGVIYTTITLQVTPQQAMQLSMTEYMGHLRAILRSPLDTKITKTPSVKPGYFVGK